MIGTLASAPRRVVVRALPESSRLDRRSTMIKLSLQSRDRFRSASRGARGGRAFGTTLGIAVLSCVAGLLACEPERATAPPPPDTTAAPLPEFTIRYIRRLPEMEWVEGSEDPAREGWPEPGQEVTWQAHVLSWAVDTAAVDFVWSLDGAPVEHGTLTLPPGETVATEYEWNWTFDRHELRFELDPDDAIVAEGTGSGANRSSVELGGQLESGSTYEVVLEVWRTLATRWEVVLPISAS